MARLNTSLPYGATEKAGRKAGATIEPLKLLESSSTKRVGAGLGDAGVDDDWVSVFDFGIFGGRNANMTRDESRLLVEKFAKGNGGGESGAS